MSQSQSPCEIVLYVIIACVSILALMSIMQPSTSGLNSSIRGIQSTCGAAIRAFQNRGKEPKREEKDELKGMDTDIAYDDGLISAGASIINDETTNQETTRNAETTNQQTSRNAELLSNIQRSSRPQRSENSRSGFAKNLGVDNPLMLLKCNNAIGPELTGSAIMSALPEPYLVALYAKGGALQKC